MIANIVSLAKSLGMSTIAEGIDHPHQAEVLRAAGCDEGQGYLFSFPIPPDGFLESWLRQGARNARG
jgi:EAL domain-containing protein (putative c-di-GMP-specific phosphodiesterase class I)